MTLKGLCTSILYRLRIGKNRWPKVLLEYGNMQLYKSAHGYEFDLNNPVMFTEKIQWYKSRYSHPDMGKIVDKYLFKQYINDKLGEGYVIPLYGAYETVEQFRRAWDNLPEKFCLKSTLQSDSRCILIIEKSKTDLNALCREVKAWFKPQNLLINSFCRAYHRATPRIIAEKYMESVKDQLYDYKFFCFNGEPYCIYTISERFQAERYPITFYDMEWSMMEVKCDNRDNQYIPRPKHFDQMVEISKKLSKEFPFVRVDFFDTPDKLLVAELTFYPSGGMLTYNPNSFNKTMGDMFHLPQ